MWQLKESKKYADWMLNRPLKSIKPDCVLYTEKFA